MFTRNPCRSVRGRGKAADLHYQESPRTDAGSPLIPLGMLRLLPL